MRRTYFSHAFTLIELLVVISIVALLSGVVLASLNSARDKAQLASGKQFEASIYHAAGDQIVSMWDFDECSGAAKDKSGRNNNLTLGSTATYSSTQTYSGLGCSLSLNGTTDYAYNNPGTFIDFDATQSFSGFAWVMSTDTSGSAQRRLFGRDLTGAAWLWFNFGNGYPYLEAKDNSGLNWNITTTSQNIADGRWHYVGYVIDRANGKSSVYIDGKLAGTKSVSSSGNFSNAGSSYFYVGIQGGSSLAFGGYIDNVRIYAKALVASEIEANYLAEKASHDFAVAR